MRILTLLFVSFFTASLSSQDLSVAEVFTDHAVLQRGVEHPVWGWDRRNRKVTVSLDGEELTTKTNREGKWELMLPPQPAGGPHTITVSDGRTDLMLEDVYFGDVYLLSGQSNMEWQLRQSDPDNSRATEIADPLIRQILVSKNGAESPREHLSLDKAWVLGTREGISGFSAVGSYFAHYLRAGGVTVPIGLVHSSWGGSRIEPWLPVEYQSEDVMRAVAERKAADTRAARGVVEKYNEVFGAGEPPVKDQGREAGYLEDHTDVSEWGTVSLPGLWEADGWANVDGVFYYRKRFNLTAAQAEGGATLSLGPIDDGDLTFVNGKKVGETPNAYSEDRLYEIPSGVLRPGENTIAIRVTDTGGGGGLFGSAEQLYLESNGGKVPLAGDWNYRIGEFQLNESGTNQTPIVLYNAMIAPLRNLPLTGVLWYQGESNAGGNDAPMYAEQMRSLIRSWREQFENDSLPFYWVQLANYLPAPTAPNEPGWATLRAQQTEALDVPRTGQAVITDIGEAGDIHPKNKWEVGRRLSLHALKDIYDKDVQASSPVAGTLEVDGEVATIRFTETGSGLMLKQDSGDRYPVVKSLTVQDDTGAWHWAVGVLDSEESTVTVINPAGRAIRKVRYAWFNNPDDANLFSRDGLPVTPFELTAGGNR